jgi:hypothetical protein
MEIGSEDMCWMPKCMGGISCICIFPEHEDVKLNGIRVHGPFE